MAKTSNSSAIPRPLNSFLIYRLEKQKEIVAKCPKANHRDISKIIAKWWKESSAEEKAPYLEKAEQAKAEHKRLYPDYKYKPKKKTTPKRAYVRKSQREKFTSLVRENNELMEMIYEDPKALVAIDVSDASKDETVTVKKTKRSPKKKVTSPYPMLQDEVQVKAEALTDSETIDTIVDEKYLEPTHCQYVKESPTLLSSSVPSSSYTPLSSQSLLFSPASSSYYGSLAETSECEADTNNCYQFDAMSPEIAEESGPITPYGHVFVPKMNGTTTFSTTFETTYFNHHHQNPTISTTSFADSIYWPESYAYTSAYKSVEVQQFQSEYMIMPYSLPLPQYINPAFLCM